MVTSSLMFFPQQNYRHHKQQHDGDRDAKVTTIGGDSYCILCPQERHEEYREAKEIAINGDIFHIIDSSYFIPDVKDRKSKYSRHSLLLLNEDGPDVSCWLCRGEQSGKTYYFCTYCKDSYHKECVESPSLFHCSDHPKHPLQLLWNPGNSYLTGKCFSCRAHSGILFYYCSICDFLIDQVCARNPTSLTIDNKKRHEHTLHYFSKRSALVCDVCGLKDDSDYLYVCLLCEFFVHKSCIYLPYVIKVSRHNHRLAFTPNLPYKEWIGCGVCHAEINKNHGEYSCKKGCIYAVHSRCAMQHDVCDGKELEDEPEEEYANTKIFEELGDGTIQHMSHPHHQMRLEKNIQRVYEENKYCQGCKFSLYDDGNLYRCMQCDFILHESCAYIPRIKEFMLHAHPLKLEFDYTTNWFACTKCFRLSSGFRYVCIKGCLSVELDILCASICEPFYHHSHPHPVFVTCDEYKSKWCSICRSEKKQPLNCLTCDFVLCFRCATLPQKVRYEHDEHLLFFSYKKYANDRFCWCEICEENIDPDNGLYACDECGVTLHINCLLGREPYIKSGESGTYSSYGHKTTVHVLPNTYSRPICKGCRCHCPYKIKIETSRGDSFCSMYCYGIY